MLIPNKLCKNYEEYSINTEVIGDLNGSIANISRVTQLYSYKAFCHNNYCDMSNNNEIYFYDNNHLNKLGSIYLAQYFQNNYTNFNLKTT